jgi:DNA polymerase/3'-5' exonuclease PolX
MPDGLVLSVPEEEDFFELCNMQWVPPQDRASASAIKAIK